MSRHLHIENPEHQVDMDGIKQGWFERAVREAIHIRMEQPSLNEDGGFITFSLSLTT